MLAAEIVAAENKTFEYYGIKGGMTKELIRKQLDLDLVVAGMKSKYPSLFGDKTNDEIVDDILERGLETSLSNQFAGKVFGRLKFLFTDQQTLWRLDVIFPKPDDPAKILAMDRALKTKFSAYSIKEESTTSQYGTSYTYRVIMIDDKALEGAVQRYADDFLKKM